MSTQTLPTTMVVITREQRGSTNGVPLTGRVYVTGPHFGGDVFSSTTGPAEASRFSRVDAESMIRRGKWKGMAARIEDVAA